MMAHRVMGGCASARVGRSRAQPHAVRVGAKSARENAPPLTRTAQKKMVFRRLKRDPS